MKRAGCRNSSAPSARRSSSSCSTRCSRSATPAIRSSAKPAAWSMNAWPSSARSACCRASIATSTSRSWRDLGSTTRSRACADATSSRPPPASPSATADALPRPRSSRSSRATTRHRRSARQPAHRRPRRVARSAPRGARVPGLGHSTSPATRSASCIAIAEPAIDAVLKATKLDGAATVAHDGSARTLLEWLRDERELTRIARPLLVQVAKHAQRRPPAARQPGHGRWPSSPPPARCRRAAALPGGVDAGGAGARAAPVAPAACIRSPPARRPSATKRISRWPWSAATPIANYWPARPRTSW